MKTYRFVWAPEGRTIVVIRARTSREAKAEFKQRFPEYRKYLGEVYFDVKCVHEGNADEGEAPWGA